MSHESIGRFKSETQKTIATLRQLAHGDAFRHGNRDALDRFFRYVHSLKSQAASRGLETLAVETNGLENVLAELRDSGREPDSESHKRVVTALDSIEHALSESPGPELKKAAQSKDAVSATTASSRAGRIGGMEPFRFDEHTRTVVHEALRRGDELFRVSCRVEESQAMLYPRLFLIVSNLEQLVTVIATDPPLDQLPGDLKEFHLLCSGTVRSQEIEKALDVDGIADLHIGPLDPKNVTEAVTNENESALSLDEQLSIGAAQVEELRIYADELEYQLHELGQRLDDDSPDSERQRGEQEHARFDLADKLAKTLRHELSRHSQIALSTLLNHVVEAIETEAKAQGKRVRVHTEGGGHKLFLPVAEVLGECILHLARNAVAHGIESPREREKAQKPVVGKIVISVAHEQMSGVSVRVSDDGAGVTLTGSPEEILDKIAAPGFTTQSEATENAGRGVGLDVVRYNVEKLLGGTLSIAYVERGNGCAFDVRIPNPGTVLGVLVVRTGRQQLAIPRVYVQNRLPIDREQIATDNTGAYFYRYGASYLRVVTPGETRLDDGATKWAVVLRLPSRRVALVVDECVSEELVVRGSVNRSEVYSKSLGKPVQLFLPLRYL